MSFILFVARHCAFRQAASQLLNREANLVAVAQVKTVAEGRERVAEGGIGAAIVDVPLPDVDAERLVRELYGAEPPVPVLVLIAPDQGGEARERFLDAGAAEVLSEGVPFAEVLAAVGRLGGVEVRAQAG